MVAGHQGGRDQGGIAGHLQICYVRFNPKADKEWRCWHIRFVPGTAVSKCSKLLARLELQVGSNQLGLPHPNTH